MFGGVLFGGAPPASTGGATSVLPGTIYTQTLTSSITPAGTITRAALFFRTFTSSITQAGTIAKAARPIRRSRLEPVGTKPPPGIPYHLWVAGDSYAWSAASGSTINYATYRWLGGITGPMTTFYDLPSGQTNATTHLYGMTVNSSGGYSGITPAGFTTEGILRDRLVQHGLPYSQVTKHEWHMPGTLLNAWASDIPAPGTNRLNPTLGRWAGMVQDMLATTGGRHIVFMPLGENDTNGAGHGNVVKGANPTDQATFDAQWAAFFTARRADADAVLGYLEEIAAAMPGSPKIEVVIPGKVNFMFRDSQQGGVPYTVPPTSDDQAIATVIHMTDGYGYFAQWNYDSTIEIERWAQLQAGLGNPTIAFVAYDFNSRLTYWRNAQPNAIGSDLLGFTAGSINGLNPYYWANATANINQQVLGPINQRLSTDVWGPACAAKSSSTHIHAIHTQVYTDPRYDMDPNLPADAYQPMRREHWIDFLHLDPDGFAWWIDATIAAWFPQSQWVELNNPQPKMLVSAVRTGAVTPTGTLNKTLRRLFTGSITAAGTVVKAATKPFTSAVTPAAPRPRTTVNQQLSSTVTPTGMLVRRTFRTFTSTLAPVGSLGRTFAQTLTSTLAPVGSLGRTITQSLGSTLAPAGTIRRRTFQSLRSTITPSTGGSNRRVSSWRRPWRRADVHRDERTPDSGRPSLRGPAVNPTHRPASWRSSRRQ